MKIEILDSYETMSARAAEEILAVIQRKPDAVICLAAGHSPQLTCEIMVMKAKEKKTDLSQVHFIGLDEWVGIGPEDPGSCQYFLKQYVLEPLAVHKNNYHLFDSLSGDLDSECKKMDDLITRLGGIDIIVLGIGMNGHLGFNEPGVSFDLKCHVIQLDKVTEEVGQKYFSEKKVLQKGITIGLAHIHQARKALLLASGQKKATIVAKALNETISPKIPASALRLHPDAIAFLDQHAASALNG